MGNCIGRKTHLRYKQQQFASTFYERDLIILRYDKQIDQTIVDFKKQNDLKPRRTSGK